MNINVIIAERHALAMPHEALVCGNSDYFIEFKFDEEWDKHPTKTARFIFDDRSYIDVVFSGTLCPVPVLKNTHEVLVGVFAGDLKTTTPAYLRSQLSVLCYGGEKTEVSQDLYDQIMQYVNDAEYRVKIDAQTASDKATLAEESATRAATSETNARDSQTAADESARAAAESVRVAVESAQAAARSEQNAGDHASTASNQADSAKSSASSASKSAQESAQSASDAAASAQASHVSAESAAAFAEEARKSVESVPDTLPNPHALKLTGAVDVEYDGTRDVEVAIPEVYIVKMLADGSSATQDEVRAAVVAKKTVLAINRKGVVYQYVGERIAEKASENGANVPSFLSNTPYPNGNLGYEYAQLLSDNTWHTITRTNLRVPNPESLHFTGAAKGSYDGSKSLTINIPKAPEPNVHIVTLTGSSSMWLSDSTWADIDAAVEAGKVCLLMLNGEVFTYAGKYRFVCSAYNDTHDAVMHNYVTINEDLSATFGGYGPDAIISTNLLTKPGYLHWDGLMWGIADRLTVDADGNATI